MLVWLDMAVNKWDKVLEQTARPTHSEIKICLMIHPDCRQRAARNNMISIWLSIDQALQHSRFHVLCWVYIACAP